MNAFNPASDAGPPSLAIEGSVATIRLRRPSQRNSLHDEDLHMLLQHFARIDADPGVRVAVLDASTHGQRKPVFSAGYHVAGFESGAHDPKLFERVPEALARLRPITVCALRGSVYGGATDLMLACDLRIALAGSEFRMPAAALGLHYYASGLQRYVSRLGLGLAQRAFLTAQALTIEELAAAGLFVGVESPKSFDSTLAALVATVAGLAPLAAQLTKQSLNELSMGDFDATRLREREARASGSSDFAEGREAFAQRRPPRFTGA
jgi:enoyl-CoA hydratase/carnithine racemase